MEIEVDALGEYAGAMRQLILRAKVRSDHRALAELGAMFAAAPQAQELGAWAEALVVCPSSLWGRLRGRLDLAHHLACCLGDAAGRPVLDAPAHLYWRLRKQAKSRSRIPAPVRKMSAPAAVLNAPAAVPVQRAASLYPDRLLLVDDVVTTGHTLRTVAASLPPGRQIRAIALSRATSV